MIDSGFTAIIELGVRPEAIPGTYLTRQLSFYRLILFETEPETGYKSVHDILEVSRDRKLSITRFNWIWTAIEVHETTNLKIVVTTRNHGGSAEFNFDVCFMDYKVAKPIVRSILKAWYADNPQTVE